MARRSLLRLKQNTNQEPPSGGLLSGGEVAKEAVQSEVADIRSHRLIGLRLAERAQKQNEWMATIEAGTPYKDILKSVYWTGVAAKLSQWDKICVRAEDGSYYAELIVTMAFKTDAVVRQIVYVELEALKEPGSVLTFKDYTVKFSGPQAKWCVIRRSDNKLLRDGLSSSAEAQQWMADHQKAVA